MSGSNSGGKRGGGSGSLVGSGAGSRGGGKGGWEEAGGEFYQESYPGGVELDFPKTSNIATLLPSKQMRGATIRRVRPIGERRQSTAPRGTTSRDVLVSMLPDLSENLSNEESTWEEIMQIKAMPVPMARKRELKAQLQSATKLRLQGFEQLQWKRRKAWQGTRAKLKEALVKLQLWRSSFKTIEGNFGTGVVAYFLLLKWLLFLNLIISVPIILFVIVPSFIFSHFVESDDYCDILLAPNSTECCSENYLNSTTSSSNPVLDIIQGTGWMEKTFLFYGLYSNKIYNYYIGGSNTNLTFVDDTSGTLMYYDMPLAYILIPIVYFGISLMAIVKSGAKGFKERLVEGEGQFYQYCNLVFGGWDFCIHNEKSANIKHKALYNEMKGCLEEERMKEEKLGRSKEDQIKLFFKRIFINLLVIVILACAGLAIFYVFNFSINELNASKSPPLNNTNNISNTYTVYDNFANNNLSNFKTASPDQNPKLTAQTLKAFLNGDITSTNANDPLFQVRTFLLEYLPSICIVSLNIVIPIIFQNLIKFENYSPGFVIKMTLFRTIFLRLASLGVLLSQLYIRIIDQTSKTNCLESTSSSGPLQCWETYVGQQLYKLLIADFVIQVFITFFVNFPRSLLARHSDSKCMKIFGEQEFNLPKHVLDVVYTQTLCWLGSFYCPFLPLIATILCFFLFYIKKFACLVNSKPSSVVYRVSRSHSLFMFVLLLSFCIAIIPVGYAIAEIPPSQSCGPFRSLGTVWEEIVITFGKFPDLLKSIVFLIGTSVFAVPAFIVLILLLYYYWAVTDANRHMVVVLKSQLVLEGHDKQFLLNRLSAFIRQQQKRNERAKHHVHSNPPDDDSIRHSSK